MAANIFVQGSLESQIQDLAIYISKLRGEEEEENAPYVKEIDGLVSAKDNQVYVKLAQDGAIFLVEKDREVEGAFNLLIVIILSSPKEIYETAVKTLINTLTKTESAKISLKQKILLNLYNALPSDSSLRYDAFIGLVDVTSQADELDSLYSQLNHIDEWAKKWGIDAATERKLYNHLSEKLKQAGEQKLAFDFLLKQLSTYKPDDAESTNLAKKVVIQAVAIENFFAFEDLLQYAAVQNLKGTEELELLNVFLNGNLSTYKTFASAHPDLLKRLNNDDNIRKIRLLSLASLGCEHMARELSYEEIAKSLEIPEDEVEMWVIDVIRAGLMEAKLNQLSKSVLVHRSIYRVFDQEQWKQLSTRLSTWKESLNEIMAVIGNAKLIAGGALQGGAAAIVVEDKTQAEVTVTTSS
ncbi:hypothetical protein VTP01DRAFT_1352 [Rhizomucor pusillus]|uniref:uncharacterized protein n=1 Tax=Rhizomucor pusillus TaxID=4840 RepID=UPI003742D56B